MFVATGFGVAAWLKKKKKEEERREREGKYKGYAVRHYCDTDVKLDVAREMNPRIAPREEGGGGEHTE